MSLLWVECFDLLRFLVSFFFFGCMYFFGVSPTKDLVCFFLCGGVVCLCLTVLPLGV